jgi:predicted O-methyltransferase YrrM|tara:strand:+ start:5297 stop:5842 length:546 start_codon:yes stop_codon:yes gene_type:complete
MSVLDDLKSLEQDSLTRGIPIVGFDKGTWLLHQVMHLQPRKVLELGTANGYSGCILGSEGAVVITIEKDAKIAAEAKQNFKKFVINAEVIVDDVLSTLKELLVDETNIESFDLIFIDCAKKLYNQVLDDCIKLVRVGGLIIADNISFDGCQDFKKRVTDHPLLRTDFVSIKDGLSCSERVN